MMGLWDLGGMAQALPEIFGAKVALVPLDPGPYGAMAYPRWLPLLKFRVQWYGAAGYGNVFAMHTRALGGRMELATLVFTPNAGGDVPLLLVDVMSMGKKRAAFVEYYDCTKDGAPGGALAATGAKFTDLPDYPEKPAWYVARRTPYSLIKGGVGADGWRLWAMLAAAVEAYGENCRRHTEAREANRAGLAAFIGQMIRQGNPASATLERVLGKAGAERFFRTLVMPETYKTKIEAGGKGL